MGGALYRVDYVGLRSAGAAVVYVGDDGVTGMDAQGGIFSGGIAVTDRARGTVVITYPRGGRLVTGKALPPNSILTVTIDERPDFLDGQPVAFPVDGRPIAVVFTKISDIPIPPAWMAAHPTP